MFFEVPTFEEELHQKWVEEDDEKWRQMMATDESWDEQEKAELYPLQIAADPRETARTESVLKGLQEAAFICEEHAARLAEGNDYHPEYDAVCECFSLIDRRIREREGQH